MIVLGLILVIVAIAAGVLLFLATQSLTEPVTLDAAGYSVGMTPLALLITGAVVLLLLWLGLALIRGAVRRRARPRREAKEAQRQAEFEENIRADERARAEELHQQQLAERDQVREQEFESRWAERDRGRDDEYRSRQADDERRIRADERARVERELAERQHSGPGVGAGAVGAGAAGAGAAAAASHHGDERLGATTTEQGAHGATVVTPSHTADNTSADDATYDDSARGPRGLHHDGTADTERDDAAAGTAGGTATGASGFDEPGTDADRTTVLDQSGADEVDPATGGRHEADRSTDADTFGDAEGAHPADETDVADSTSDGTDQPPYRTVADKLMGRDGPEDGTSR